MSVMTLPVNLDQLSADELRELVRRQAEVITRNDRELNWRQVKIDKLTHEVAYYKRHYFGVKAERLPVEQGQLFEETLAADMAAMTEELALRIPAQAGQRFQPKLDSDSKASWTLIPAQPGQPKVIT